MTEVLSKTNLIPSWNRNKQQHCHGMSQVPRTCHYSYGVSCALGRFPSLKLKYQVPRSSSPCSSSLSASQFHGKKVGFHVNKVMPRRRNPLFRVSTSPQRTLRIGNTEKWWEKGLQPNMKEVTSAQDLVDSLLNAGDKLVIVNFFSPGCGGCKALHPKVCQFAEMNPDVLFLQLNNEEHKSMCYSLNVHVLPFFRFYRGAHGRLCSFSCTNATIKKFRDALAEHTPDRCSLGPTKGLEEKELLALAANKDLSFTYTPKPDEPLHAPPLEDVAADSVKTAPTSAYHHRKTPSFTFKPPEESKERKLTITGR